LQSIACDDLRQQPLPLTAGASLYAAGDMSAEPDRDASASEALIAKWQARVLPDRSCGTCTLCCKVVSVLEIDKPGGVWCPHCVSGKRCAIYQSRFFSCRVFYCQWMLEQGLGPEWKPDRAKFVLVNTEANRHLTACADPGYPSAWRRSPYYEQLRRWAAEGLQKFPDLHIVNAMIGSRCIVILPDRDVDIGVLAADEMIELSAAGAGFEARKAKRPVLAR
jgi:hypothetical protein